MWLHIYVYICPLEMVCSYLNLLIHLTVNIGVCSIWFSHKYIYL